MKGRTILATRKFLNECNEVIHLNTTYVQHPTRVNDVLIIDLVNTQTIHKVTMNQKEKINCVQVYIEVHNVSETCTINDDNFVPGVLDGKNIHLTTKQLLQRQVKKS